MTNINKYWQISTHPSAISLICGVHLKTGLNTKVVTFWKRYLCLKLWILNSCVRNSERKNSCVRISEKRFLCSKFWKIFLFSKFWRKEDSCVRISEKDSCVKNSKKYSCVQNWLERLNKFYLFSLSCASNMDFHDILN